MKLNRAFHYSKYLAKNSLWLTSACIFLQVKSLPVCSENNLQASVEVQALFIQSSSDGLDQLLC